MYTKGQLNEVEAILWGGNWGNLFMSIRSDSYPNKAYLRTTKENLACTVESPD